MDNYNALVRDDILANVLTMITSTHFDNDHHFAELPIDFDVPKPDTIDSREWLDPLIANHKEFDFPNAGYDYVDCHDEFMGKLVGSVGWRLSRS